MYLVSCANTHHDVTGFGVDGMFRNTKFSQELKNKNIARLFHEIKRSLNCISETVKDTGDLLEKVKSLGRIPEDACLVTADVLGLYPSILHDAGLKALCKKVEERTDKKVPSADLIDMAEFALKNNFFEFDSKVKQQISGTATATKFAPPYICISMDKVDYFLEIQTVELLVWRRHIVNIIFIWNKSTEKLE